MYSPNSFPFPHSYITLSVDVEALTPLRLKDGDIICVGSTELLVRITDMEESDLRE